MKHIIALLLFTNFLYSSYVEEQVWWKGETLLTFFEKHHIPLKVYFDLSKTDKELCSEISAGVKFQKLVNEKDSKLEQALIPISEEMQLHIFKDENKNFVLDIIPNRIQRGNPDHIDPYQKLTI